MRIESLIIAHLSKQLSVPVYGDMPDRGAVPEFVTVEKTGSNLSDHIYSATLAVQSWSTSRAAADELNEKVKAAMAKALELNEISRCALETDYNYPDLSTKRPRYQAIYEVVCFN